MTTAAQPAVPPPQRRRRRRIAGAAALAAVCGALAWTAVRPSHDRDWLPDQRLLPTARFDGSHVVIDNVRNFRYAAPPAGIIAERYEQRTYDLDGLTSVWFMLVPFSRDWRGPAHSFLSFGFDDGRFLSISVEARREQGEAYSMLGGMLKRFEIAYIIGDELDLVSLRALRGDVVHAYPVRTTPERMRAVLTAMLERANAIAARPEFYNTLTNNCTTSILQHANAVAERRIPYGWRVLLPGYSDQLALRHGLIDTTLPLADARRHFDVTERVALHLDDPDFSLRIRADL